MAKAPNTLRNVTGEEVLAIIAADDFIAPPDIDQSAWGKAVAEVRSAVSKLGKTLNFPLNQKKTHISRDVCNPATRLIEARDDIEQNLLEDKTIQKVRAEIALRLTIRSRLGSHEQFQNLLDYIKKHDGQLIRMKLIKDKKTFQIHSVIANIMRGFGEQEERKRLVFSLIEKFLSECAGRKVEFINLKFIDRKRGNRSTEEEKDSGTELAELRTLRETALESLQDLRANLEAYIAGLDQALKGIYPEIAKVDREVNDIRGGTFANAERELASVKKREIEITADYATVEEGMRTKHRLSGHSGTFEIPQNHIREREKALRRHRKENSNIYDQCEGIMRQLDVLKKRKAALQDAKVSLPERIKRVRELLLRLQNNPLEDGKLSVSPPAASPRVALQPATPNSAAGVVLPEGSGFSRRLVTMSDFSEALNQEGIVQVTTYNKAMFRFLSFLPNQESITVGITIRVAIKKRSSRLILMSLENEDANVWLIDSLENLKKANLYVA